MSTLTIEFRGMSEEILNELVKKGYAKTKAEAIRQAVIYLGKEFHLFQKKETEEDEWKKYAIKKALEDWDDARKLFKF